MSTHGERVILGIDPGFDRMGYGYIVSSSVGERLLSYGCVSTSKEQTFGDRLLSLAEQLDELITQQKPDCAGIEKLYFSTNVKTAMDVGQARGVIILALKRHGIPVVECTPQQVKLAATGYGAADKRQVQSMITLLLKLKETPKPDDAADALAIALCASRNHALY